MPMILLDISQAGTGIGIKQAVNPSSTYEPQQAL